MRIDSIFNLFVLIWQSKRQEQAILRKEHACNLIYSEYAAYIYTGNSCVRHVRQVFFRTKCSEYGKQSMSNKVWQITK